MRGRNMTATGNDDRQAEAPGRAPLVYRQSTWTRVTHWVWAVCLFFLLLTGLQIFNAHPTLYIGEQSGFGFPNAVLSIGAAPTEAGPVGYTEIFGWRFETTGVLGLSGSIPEQMQVRAFPAWATIPSHRDLATGRVVHFFFAWLLLFTLLIWLVASLVNGHIARDLRPRRTDLRRLPRDLAEHVRMTFRRKREYSPSQKLSYAVVLFILLPLMFLTGLSMSPSFNAVVPWLADLLGGRQTARTIHFVVMLLLVGFFVIHIVMVLLAGPLNEMRSMITGWYRVDDRREGK